MMDTFLSGSARILLEWLLDRESGELGEDTAPYGPCLGIDLDLLDVRELMALYMEVGARLARAGIDPAGEDPAPVVEEIRINRDYRIFLPERDGIELRLRPIVKTVFILFLKHPEGIVLKEIGDYREELSVIYSRITRRSDPAVVSATVDRLVDVMDNSLHENCSRLNTALADYFKGGALEDLRIKGKYGGLRRIRHEEVRVSWEADDD